MRYLVTIGIGLVAVVVLSLLQCPHNGCDDDCQERQGYGGLSNATRNGISTKPCGATGRELRVALPTVGDAVDGRVGATLLAPPFHAQSSYSEPRVSCEGPLDGRVGVIGLPTR